MRFVKDGANRNTQIANFVGRKAKLAAPQLNCQRFAPSLSDDDTSTTKPCSTAHVMHIHMSI